MSIKRTIITTIAVLAMVAVVAPAAAQADVLSDLMAQIQTLQAQLLALQGGSSAGTGLCAGVTFTRNLTVGSIGSDVKCLQQILSVTPTSGYFGPLTLAAVRQYQSEKGFIPANQVGPMTRAALNAQLGGAPAGNLPAGCTSTAGFSPTTGVSCATGAIITTGGTGFLSVSSLAAAPANDANITATSNVPILGLNIKAIGSDMKVTSAKVLLHSTLTAVEHPATLIHNLYAYDGSTLLGTFPVNTSTVIKDVSNYYVILSGLNFNIPANTTKVLTISADFAPTLETDRTLEVALLSTTAIRAVDGTGVFSEAGLEPTLTAGDPAANNRTYTINYDAVGTSTLTGTASINTPVSTSINVNATSGTTDVPMLVFNAKSTVGASRLTDLVFTVRGTNSAVAKTSALKLYDGSTLLGSVSLSSAISGATATFSDLTVDIAKDVTKALTVKADIAAGVSSNTLLSVIITPSAQFTFTTPNLSAGTPVGTLIEGKIMHLFSGQAAVLTFVSGSSTYTYNPTDPTQSYTTGIIVFDIKADGGTLTELVTGNSVVNAYWNTTALASGSVDVKVSPDTDTPDGSTARVTVTMTVSRTVSTKGVFVNFKIGNGTSDGVVWTVGDSGAITQFWGLTDFKTPAVSAN